MSNTLSTNATFQQVLGDEANVDLSKEIRGFADFPSCFAIDTLCTWPQAITRKDAGRQITSPWTFADQVGKKVSLQTGKGRETSHRKATTRC